MGPAPTAGDDTGQKQLPAVATLPAGLGVAADGVTITHTLSARLAGNVAYERGLCPFCLQPDHGPPGTVGCDLVEIEVAEAALGIVPSTSAESHQGSTEQHRCPVEARSGEIGKRP
jgi:hypothetical protein